MFFACIAPDFFSFLFGEKWEVAGDYAQWITLLVYGAIVVSPLMVLFSVLEQQGQEFIFQILFFSVRLLSIFIGWYFDSVLLSLAIYCCCSALMYFLFVLWICWALRINALNFYIPTLKVLGVGIALLLPALYALGVNAVGLEWMVLNLVSFVFVILYLLFIIRKA